MCGVQFGQLMPPDRGPTNQPASRSPGSACDSLNILLYGKCETITPGKLGKSVPLSKINVKLLWNVATERDHGLRTIQSVTS